MGYEIWADTETKDVLVKAVDGTSSPEDAINAALAMRSDLRKVKVDGKRAEVRALEIFQVDERNPVSFHRGATEQPEQGLALKVSPRKWRPTQLPSAPRADYSGKPKTEAFVRLRVQGRRAPMYFGSMGDQGVAEESAKKIVRDRVAVTREGGRQLTLRGDADVIVRDVRFLARIVS